MALFWVGVSRNVIMANLYYTDAGTEINLNSSWLPGSTDMEKLNRAFQELRTMGYIARQGYKCCSSCAGYALTETAVSRVEKGKAVRGAVFYHQQDKASFLNDGPLHIRFSNLDSQKKGLIGIEPLAIGKEVVEVFKKHGISTQWDGNPSTTIKVGCS